MNGSTDLLLNITIGSILGIAPLLMGKKQGKKLAGMIGFFCCMAASCFGFPVAVAVCGISYFIIQKK